MNPYAPPVEKPSAVHQLRRPHQHSVLKSLLIELLVAGIILALVFGPMVLS